MSSEAYFTLLLSDSYLPGCLALVEALRGTGTTKPVVVLALDQLAPESLAALESAFDSVVPVSVINNPAPRNLISLGRPDLALSFTKLALWSMTEYDRIVYLDADVLPLTNLDNLFSVPGVLAAAPDAGWPDIFNSGVMVLTPSKADFDGLYATAESTESFDGGDQGLLNTYFADKWTRLSFMYNVTPSAGYQYMPAYVHFASQIKAVHFTGLPKPWQLNRPSGPTSTGQYDDLLTKWWAAYDASAPPEPESSGPDLADQIGAMSVQQWDPAVSEPPKSTSGEALGLPSVSYTNEWDKPYSPETDTKFVPPEL
ncbi:Glycogenin-1 [Lipomyces arxii]|uniref:Glycogenin-1 n=1 Tax=Lipomyces arxii TaxID=56418 RepID=UPI0034CD4CBC